MKSASRWSLLLRISRTLFGPGFVHGWKKSTWRTHRRPQPDAFIERSSPTGSPYSASRFVSSASGVDLQRGPENDKQLPHLSSAFKSAPFGVLLRHEKSLGTQVKHLISQQPISTRNNLELGKLTIVKEQYIDYQPISLMPKIRERDDHNLLVKTERMGQIHTYADRSETRKNYRTYRPGRFSTWKIPNRSHPS